MLIGGLWHGAAWKFVFWGAMHGAGLAAHKAARPWLSKIPDTKIVSAISWLATICFVSVLWVFFRADSYGDSITILGKVFTDFSPAHIMPFVSARMLWLILMIVIIAAHALPEDMHGRLSEMFIKSPWIVKLLVFIVVVQLVLELQSESVAPFIYFRF